MFSRKDLFQEYLRRKTVQNSTFEKIKLLRDPNFKMQNEVLDAREFRFKAINCTRRGGKSVTEVIDHLEVSQLFPRSSQLYMGLSLDSVTEICWELFKELIAQAGINAKYNQTKKIIFFGNGSRVRLFGLNANEREMRKVLGQKLRKVSIDEAGSFTIDMVKVCYQMLAPALSDLAPNSWLTLLGTCENIPNTFFQAVTEGRETGRDWKVFRWTTYDNPHMAKQWDAEIKAILKANPLNAETSWFKTHYLNIWCTDDDLIIIGVSDQNKLKFKPDDYRSPFYILGVDLGWKDASSFTVICFSHHSKQAHIVLSYKKNKLDFSNVAAEVKKLQKSYEFIKLIIDGANKQGVEEIRNRHHLSFEAAEKSEKAFYLKLLKDDMTSLAVLVDPETCVDLITEWQSLIWVDDKKVKEDPRCENHCSDSALYAWRAARHYAYEPPDPKHNKDTDEYMQELLRRESEAAKRQAEEDRLYGTGAVDLAA